MNLKWIYRGMGRAEKDDGEGERKGKKRLTLSDEG
jgi:hypothetical protein